MPQMFSVECVLAAQKQLYSIFTAIEKITTMHCMGQNYHFSVMPKFIRILTSCSMKIFSTFHTIDLIFD